MDNNGLVLISVIVPAYNAMDCLEKCIASIAKQTYSNLEIIIVDDGSSDNTGALAEKLALMDKRIKVYHKENGGSSSARNLGISKAHGDFLGFVDADDYIEPEMYERMLLVAMQESLLMVQTGRDEVSADGSKREDVCTPPEEVKVFDDHYFMRELLLHRGDCSFCTKLTHASLFSELRFPEGELNEDFYLLVQMLKKTVAIGSLPWQDYHVFYRMCSNTRTTDENVFPSVYKDIVVNADRVMEIVKKDYPELILEAKRFGLFQRLEYMLHIPIGMMNSKNKFYVSVRRYLRKYKWSALGNKYLTKKNKQYIFVLGMAPKLVRKVHRLKMKGQK